MTAFEVTCSARTPGIDRPFDGPAGDDTTAMNRFHLDVVALQREFPELLGARTLTGCPHDQPEPPRSTLAAFMRSNQRAAALGVAP